jgi:hypothetical protein
MCKHLTENFEWLKIIYSKIEDNNLAIQNTLKWTCRDPKAATKGSKYRTPKVK